jgi:hypothetical protein
MKVMKLLYRASLLLALVLATGCASVKKAPMDEDRAAKAFRPNTEVAQVYVYRNETLGAALSMPVTVNGKLAGTTGPKSFFKFDLPAGKHQFTSQGDKSVLDLNTQKGDIYYIWQEVKMGVMSGGSKLQLVDEAKGQKGVMQCELIDSAL